MTRAAQSGLPPRRVFISGMFDMKNFGDLLFPLVARERLAPLGVEIVPVSPTGAETGFVDAMDSLPLSALFESEAPADGIIVGGGYIIHAHKMHFLQEYAGTLAEYAGPGLWMGATLAATCRDIPIVWNAPGVPHPFSRHQRQLVDAAVRASDYPSLRDRGSAELLALPEDVSLTIVPDSIAAIGRLWSKRALEANFRALLERKSAPAARGYVALHVRNRSLAGMQAPAAADMINTFSRQSGLCPLLVAVGQTHADDVVARDIARHIAVPHLLLDDPLSLAEIAAALAHSALYLGASLHGYIVATAYGVPGVLVAQPSYRKFQGFLDHTGGHADLARNWPEAFGMASRAGEEHHGVPRSVENALDLHWRRIAESLSSPDRNRGSRLSFLRTWIRAGTQAGGPTWLHLPYAMRANLMSLGEIRPEAQR